MFESPKTPTLHFLYILKKSVSSLQIFTLIRSSHLNTLKRGICLGGKHFIQREGSTLSNTLSYTLTELLHKMGNSNLIS